MSEGKRSVGSGLTAAVLGAGVAGLNVQQRVDEASSVHGHQDVEVRGFSTCGETTHGGQMIIFWSI